MGFPTLLSGTDTATDVEAPPSKLGLNVLSQRLENVTGIELHPVIVVAFLVPQCHLS